jgi:hypothetical protein
MSMGALVAGLTSGDCMCPLNFKKNLILQFIMQYTHFYKQLLCDHFPSDRCEEIAVHPELAIPPWTQLHGQCRGILRGSLFEMLA